MAGVGADASLASHLERLLPGLWEDTTERTLVEALLRCCKQLGITKDSELLLWLVADSPFVQRHLLLKMTDGHGRHISCPSETVQHLVERVVWALSEEHVSRLQADVSGVAGHTKPGVSSISRSVKSLLDLNATGNCTSSLSLTLRNKNISEASCRNALFFTTGCPSVDRLFRGTSNKYNASKNEAGRCEGGFRAGLLTEVYGEAGSGKTQLVLQCLLQSVAHHLCGLWGSEVGVRHRNTGSPIGVAALYIVSEDFPAARLGPLAAGALEREKQQALCEASYLPSSQVAQLKEYLDEAVTVSSILAGLQIRRIDSLKELLRLFQDGTISVAFRTLGGKGVVVVDSIAGAATAGTGGEGIAWNENVREELVSDVVAVGVAMKTFAVREGAAVVVTNQVRSLLLPGEHSHRYAMGMVVPALGIQWSLAPHVRVHLRRLHTAPGTVHRQLTVLYGPMHPPVCGMYVIGVDGIRDYL